MWVKTRGGAGAWVAVAVTRRPVSCLAFLLQNADHVDRGATHRAISTASMGLGPCLCAESASKVMVLPFSAIPSNTSPCFHSLCAIKNPVLLGPRFHYRAFCARGVRWSQVQRKAICAKRVISRYVASKRSARPVLRLVASAGLMRPSFVYFRMICRNRNAPKAGIQTRNGRSNPRSRWKTGVARNHKPRIMNASARNMHNSEAIKIVVDKSNMCLVLTGTKLGIRHPSSPYRRRSRGAGCASIALEAAGQRVLSVTGSG